MIVDAAMRNAKRGSSDGTALTPTTTASRPKGTSRDVFGCYQHGSAVVLLIIASSTCAHANPSYTSNQKRRLASDDAANKRNNGGLSSGELIGIILASVFGSVLMLFFVIWGWHKVKQRRGEKVEREYAEEMMAAVATGRRSRLAAEGDDGAVVELGGSKGEDGAGRLSERDLGVGGAERYVIAVRNAGGEGEC